MKIKYYTLSTKRYAYLARVVSYGMDRHVDEVDEIWDIEHIYFEYDEPDKLTYRNTPAKDIPESDRTFPARLSEKNMFDTYSAAAHHIVKRIFK